MPKVVGNIVWKLLVLAISRPVASTLRDTVQSVWAKSRPGNPPRTAADPDAKWVDAILYAGLTGVGFAVGELVAQRGAAEIWRTFGGGETPDQRKLREAAEKEKAKAAKLSPRQRAAAIRKRDAATYAKSAKKRVKSFAS
ncbi:DUF4235 domain-containing protein [Jatrophihabitans sp. YIM 134969]